MTPRHAAAALALVALAGVAAGCSGSTTNGSGQAASHSSSHPDFPPTTAATSASKTSSAPRTSSSHPAQPLSTKQVAGSGGRSYTVDIWAEKSDPTCYEHAYGKPVVDFLVKHPCSGLKRILATTAVNGRPVAFALSETGFFTPGQDPYKYTGEFVQLLKANNTGSLDDLLREGYRIPNGPKAIPSDEVFNVLTQDTGISVYDIWYLDGTTAADDPALIQFTQDSFLQI